MKMKIRNKLIGVNFFIIAIIILSQFITQNHFFQKYYDAFKKKQLAEAFDTYENKLSKGEDTRAFLEEITKDGIYLYRLDDKMKIIEEDLSNRSTLKILTEDERVIVFENILLPKYKNYIKEGDYIQIKVAENSLNGEEIIKEVIIEEDGQEKVIFKSFGIGQTKGSFIERTIKGNVLEFEGNDKLINSGGLMDFRLSIEKISELTKGNEGDFNIVIGSRMVLIKRYEEGYIAGTISIEGSKNTLDILKGFNLMILIPNCIIAIIVIFFFSNGITKPILKMKEFAKSIALGRYGTKVEINSGDELEELGEALNDISIKLDEYVVKTKEDYEDKIQREKKHKFMLMNISHDLKTPLTVIKGYLKAIKDGIYDKDEYIDYTIEGVDDISETLTEMLELSKLKSDKYELHFQTSDFTRLVYKVINNLLPVAKSKNQNINFHLLEDVFLNIDENEMKKALENIVMNAIKYSPEESRINVSLTENVDEYIFSVENENTHIPEEEIENIFEEFYRVDKARNRNNRGSGLGLVIVKAILENHKRKFCIKNTEKGVKFNIYFEK